MWPPLLVLRRLSLSLSLKEDQDQQKREREMCITPFLNTLLIPKVQMKFSNLDFILKKRRVEVLVCWYSLGVVDSTRSLVYASTSPLLSISSVLLRGVEYTRAVIDSFIYKV